MFSMAGLVIVKVMAVVVLGVLMVTPATSQSHFELGEYKHLLILHPPTLPANPKKMVS